MYLEISVSLYIFQGRIDMAKGNPYNLIESGSLSLFEKYLSELHSDIVAENQRANREQEEIQLSGMTNVDHVI